MSHLCQTVSALIERARTAPEGTARLRQPLAAQSDVSGVDWLDAQTLYPKLYWQSRDGQEEVVALGQHAVYSDPQPACALLQDEQRVWGCRAFDAEENRSDPTLSSYFFLPCIELIREGETWSLAVNLHGGKVSVIAKLRQLVTKKNLLSAMSGPDIAAPVVSVRHTPNQTHWYRLVDDALAGIQAGQFGKVVLARQTTVKTSAGISAAQLLKASRQVNQQSFHFMLALDEQQAFVGSSPERLYQRDGASLQTEALAGTIGRGRTPAQDQQWARWLSLDVKNRQENQYVVDDITDRLAPYVDHLDAETSPALLQLRQVQHLKRHIRARLKPGVCSVNLLHTLQPTAAVAGLPRQPAMQFIRQHEPFDRGWYAGSLGYVSREKAEFCVAIRSAYVLPDQLQLFAGAGIVAGSEAGSEWQELDRKMSTLLALVEDCAAATHVSEVA
ncbi:isochorismate synthase [Photobacterium halotolerans]|uniref:Isochorismate synthase MenF n=1 Tax=Photobacterium halotolerans TaxID=265726 RepID=A0A7X4WH16_9GAMM|nr:isochorismate synthase [Photobacterium halotolerans]